MKVIAAGRLAKPIVLGAAPRRTPVVVLAGLRGPAGAGGVQSFNDRVGIVSLTGADVTTALGYSPVNGGSLASVAFTGSYTDLSGTPFIPSTPGDIGAATAAQGALADTAVQPGALAALLDLKVDKIVGYGLSQEDFTTAEKAKLAGLEGSHFKGVFASLGALQAAFPTASAGDYADVDAGVGSDTIRHVWDASDEEWQPVGAGAPLTAADIKTLYESNPDTNAYTDAEKSKLAGVAAGATANANTDSLAEGSTNLYHTAARVLATVLSGLSLASGSAVVDTDTVVVAFGKLQRQVNDLAEAIGGKQDALVSGTNIKTVNGNSLLGGGNLEIEGGTGGLEPFDVVASEDLEDGDFVNIYTDGGNARVRKADGGAAKRKAHGFVKVGVLNTQTASVTPLGGENDAMAGLTPGTEYFLSTAVPGAVQSTLPAGSGILRQELGVAVSATSLATINGLTVELV